MVLKRISQWSCHIMHQKMQARSTLSKYIQSLGTIAVVEDRVGVRVVISFFLSLTLPLF